MIKRSRGLICSFVGQGQALPLLTRAAIPPRPTHFARLPANPAATWNSSIIDTLGAAAAGIVVAPQFFKYLQFFLLGLLPSFVVFCLLVRRAGVWACDCRCLVAPEKSPRLSSLAAAGFFWGLCRCPWLSAWLVAFAKRRRSLYRVPCVPLRLLRGFHFLWRFQPTRLIG